MSEEDVGEVKENLSPKRSPKKLIVQPSVRRGEQVEKIELEPVVNGESKPAVLALEEPVVAVEDTEKKKKKWWQKKGDDGDDKKTKTVPIYMLFRYGTALDYILIFISIVFAIINGAALPGSMYVFGDLTNLYVNYDISLRIFSNVSETLAGDFDQITFLPNSSINSIGVAANASIITPELVMYEDNLTDYISLNPNSSIVSEAASSVSCIVFVFARDESTSAFNILQGLVNGTYTITPTNAGCDCLDPLFEAFNSEVRCLTDDTFINGERPGDGILWIIYLFLIITGAVFISSFIQIAFMQVACERQVQKMRLNYYRSVLRQDIAWFDFNPSGEVSSRLNDDINKIHDGIGDKFSILIQWVATFFAAFVIGFVREWRMTLFLIAVTPFLAVVAGVFSKVIAAFASQEQKLYAAAGAIAEEVLQSVRTVVAFGGEEVEAARYKVHLSHARKLGTTKGVSVGFSLSLTYFIIFASYGFSFWFGGFLVQQQIINTGDMLAVFFAVIIGAFSLGQAAPNVESILTAAGAAGEIFETIDREPPIDSSSSDGLIPDKLSPMIQFKDICFSYPARPDIQVMKGLNLEIKVGQTVALVGPSGCGKSTVIQLLQRFYNPDAGQILLDGNDIRDLNLQWLRSNIGVVSQEPVLFDATIAENIRYGREDATLSDIEEAAKAANAYDFIQNLPNGFNTNVGERGTQLSGGQKQRIAIARALVRDPKIILLDEATSALDAESEKIVQDALDKASAGRTTIIVAHRLSTIQTADVIAGIEDGRVIEMGSHAELMDKEGLYYELVNAQTHVDIDDDKEFRSPTHKRGTSLRKRGWGRSVSESDDQELKRVGSVRRQISRQHSAKQAKGDGEKDMAAEISEKDLEKLQEEWDKDIPEVSLVRVLKANAKEWWLILLGMFGSLVLGSIFPLFAVIFGELLDVLARPADEILDSLHLYAGLFLVLGVVSGLAVFFKSVCFTVAGEELTARMRYWSFKAILRQEVGWFDSDRNSSGILATRLAQDASQVQGATGTRLGTLMETTVGMILALIIAMVYAWMLTLVLLLMVPIMIFAGFLQLKALTGHASENKKALEEAGKIAIDSMENIRTVASLGVEPMFYSSYCTSVTNPYKRSLVNSNVYGATYGFSQGVLFFGYILTFGFGAYQVMQPSDHIAHETFTDVFVAFMAVIFGAFGVGQASSFAPNYAKAKLSANRIYSLLDREPEIDGYSEDGLKPEKIESEIQVEGVQFHYPSRPEVEVLQGLSIGVQPGQTLALVGPSGCGKSTIVSLLERFYDVQGGTMKLHDNDIRDLNIRWLRSQIGIVSQEPILFDKSIADNIRYGANFREVNEEEIVEAAKAANIHNFIQSLPEGYNTNVGSKGTQLSGGQKQRIAIARALVRDPKILLLDEATSALDTESEKVVQEALDKARQGRTTIVIAHRLSTIYNSDCIAVISNGKVVEKGTHSELLAAKGIYYRLNQYQLKEEREKSESVGPTSPTGLEQEEDRVEC